MDHPKCSSKIDTYAPKRSKRAREAFGEPFCFVCKYLILLLFVATQQTRVKYKQGVKCLFPKIFFKKSARLLAHSFGFPLC